MRLATIRLSDGTTAAVRVDSDGAVDTGAADVGELLRQADWSHLAAAAGGAKRSLEDLDYAALVPRPGKIICVGLNYRRHIEETGQPTPLFPTLFAKFSDSLIGAHDTIVLPTVSDRVDWEAELAVIIGRRARYTAVDQARGAIAGYAVLNDVSVRDWQRRTSQWLQGKTFESTCPLGPWLVTPDECNDAEGLTISCSVNGKTVQAGDTSDMVFKPADLVAYISTVLTLEPGDVIATGTPAGIGDAMQPPEYLSEGDILLTRIESLGECRNTSRCDPAATAETRFD